MLGDARRNQVGLGNVGLVLVDVDIDHATEERMVIRGDAALPACGAMILIGKRRALRLVVLSWLCGVR